MASFLVGAAPSARTVLITMGSSTVTGRASCVDADGNAYITGKANALQLPVTPGAYQPPANATRAGFVAKLAPNGNIVLFLYLAGTTFDEPQAIAVDKDKNIYVAGRTNSADFPVTSGAYQTTPGAGVQDLADGFLTKISADGSKLLYSTYLGGSAYDSIDTLAVDGQGRAYVAGTTGSADFPLKGGLSTKGTGQAFVARFNATGSGLEYSARFGATSTAVVNAIQVGSDGTAYLGGSVVGRDFPIVNAVQDHSATATLFLSGNEFSWSGSPLFGPVYAAAGDPADPKVYYLGTDGGILRTKDHGANWETRAFDQPLGSNLAGRVVWIDVNPWNSKLLATSIPNSGTYVSKDGGDTWSLASREAGLHVYQVSADGQTLVTDAFGNIRRSTDGGKTFAYVTLNPASGFPGGDTQRLVARDIENPDGVFLTQYSGTTTDMGLYRLSGGGTVEKLSTYRDSISIAQDPNAPAILYSAGSAQVMRSADRGKTWATFSPAFTSSVTSIAISPDSQRLVAATRKGMYTAAAPQFPWASIAGPANVNVSTVLYDSSNSKWLAIADQGADGFVMSVAPDGSGMLFSSYLGGSGSDRVGGLALLSQGTVVVTGDTYSLDLPVSAGAAQSQPGPGFVATLNTLSSTIMALTYTGGSASFLPYAVAFDGNSRVAVAGASTGPGFPQTVVLASGAQFDQFLAPSFVVYDLALSGVQSASRLGLTGEARSVAFSPQGKLVLGGTGRGISGVDFPLQSTGGGTAGAIVSFFDPAGGTGELLSISPVYFSGIGSGFAGSILVTTHGQTVPWTAVPDVPWITLSGGTSGSGASVVNFMALPNTSVNARSGSISVNGLKAMVQQAGVVGAVSGVSSYSSSIAASGTTITVQVTTTATDYTWTAGSSVFWATVSPGGTGSGPLTITFAPNATGSTRQATITVGSQILTFTQAANTTVLPGLRFVAITPCRVADTRLAPGTFGAPTMGANSSRDFPIPSSTCGIPASAAAYSLNVTVVPQGPLSFLTAWPAGQPRPLVSTLNSDGRVKANAAIVPAGLNGAISVYATNPTDVILDINGYFVPDTGLQFYPLTPCRVADTRNGSTPIAAGQARSFAIAASGCGAPVTAQAFALNMTAVPKEPLSFLTLWPSGQSRPFVSTLNSPNGGVVANAAIVPAGANGSVSVYVTNPSDVIVDINGYFAPPTPSGLSFYPVTPCRIWDTRNTSILAAQQPQIIRYPGTGTCDPAADPPVYSLNATVVPATVLSYLTLGPANLPLPFVSTLNSPDGSVVANAAIVPAAGGIQAFAPQATHLILDVNGYFAP